MKTRVISKGNDKILLETLKYTQDYYKQEVLIFKTIYKEFNQINNSL